MRYLGLLYDSLREAMDSKVLYLTLSLSLILVSAVVSTSFWPATMREEVQRICDTLDFVFKLKAMQQNASTKVPATCSIVQVTQTNPRAPQWQGNYEIELLLRLPAGMNPKESTEATFEFLGLTQLNLWYLNQKDVEHNIRANGREVTLKINSAGTKILSREDWPHRVGLIFGLYELPDIVFHSSLNYRVYSIQNLLVNTVGGWAIVLIGILVTAGFVPNMLEKGTVDLLLVKPISRPTLLIFKYLGGLAFVFVNSVIAIGGVWLALGLRTGIWTWSFPLSILVLTAFFAIVYSVSVLFGVLTRNTILCIMMTCLVWLLLFIIGFAYNQYYPAPEPDDLGRLSQTKKARPALTSSDDTIRTVVETLHFVLPRTNDLGHLTTNLISQELLSEEERKRQGFRDAPPFTWAESLTVSGLFVALLLGLACWRFSVQEF